MRTTEGKETLDVALHGAPDEARALADALDRPGRADRLTHGFHAYPAGLHADTAAALLALLPGRRVLDPFCGGGTVLVEAMTDGREGEGRDLSEVALLVATARTTLASDADLTALRSAARAIAAAARRHEAPPPARVAGLAEWYEPHVLRELEGVRRGVVAAEVSDDVRRLLWACLSAIVVKASLRRSESSARAEPRHRPPGTTAVLFHKKARELARRLLDLREATPPHGVEPRILRGDARRIAVDEPVDVVLTSPPYPSVYDYLPMQQLREAWLGVHSDAGREIGPRRAWRREGAKAARRRWLEDTAAWTASAASVLAPGGALVVVVGDGLVEEGPVETREPSVHAARLAGLRLVAGASLLRPDHARRATRWEHVLRFERSPAARNSAIGPVDAAPGLR